MVADGDVFVVGEQRRIRSEELAYIGGVVDACVEVCVAGDVAREVECAIGGLVEQVWAWGLTFGKEVRDGLAVGCCKLRGGEVEDVVADGNAGAGGLAGWAEEAVGEVLDGEVGVAVGVGEPGAEVRVVSLVDAHCCPSIP